MGLPQDNGGSGQYNSEGNDGPGRGRPPESARLSVRWLQASWWTGVQGLAALAGVLLAVASLVAAWIIWWFPRSAPATTSTPGTVASPLTTPTATPLSELTDSSRDLLCSSGRAELTLQNHASRLYLAGYDRPRLANDHVPRSVVRVDAGNTCTVIIHAGTDRPYDCMAVGGQIGQGADVVWQACSNQPGLGWIVESHWKNDFGEWFERLHPVGDQSLCLQAVTTAGVGTPMDVEPCDAGWLQQWKLAASA
jgi:hypothetical protein